MELTLDQAPGAGFWALASQVLAAPGNAIDPSTFHWQLDGVSAQRSRPTQGELGLHLSGAVDASGVLGKVRIRSVSQACRTALAGTGWHLCVLKPDFDTLTTGQATGAGMPSATITSTAANRLLGRESPDPTTRQYSRSMTCAAGPGRCSSTMRTTGRPVARVSRSA